MVCLARPFQTCDRPCRLLELPPPRILASSFATDGFSATLIALITIPAYKRHAQAASQPTRIASRASRYSSGGSSCCLASLLSLPVAPVGAVGGVSCPLNGGLCELAGPAKAQKRTSMDQEHNPS